MARFGTLLIVMLSLVGPPSVVAQHKTLFVGNSYTFANSNLVAEGYAALVAETAGEAPVVEVVAKGGYTLAGHLEDTGQEGEQLNELLAGEDAAWSVVVLQEQSVIPAYHEAVAFEWYDSLAAAAGLNDVAEAAGADTVFLMTWGRREGLPQDLEMLPDYPTMQALLEGGYQQYVDYTSTPERPTLMAPVGLAWQAIFEDTLAAGADPLDPEGLFWNLYTGDGSHPSVTGSYLAALVVFATVTGADPTETLWVPDSVTAEEAAALRSVARRVVLGDPVEPVVDAAEDSMADIAEQSADVQVQSDLTVAPDLPAVEISGLQELPQVSVDATVETPDAALPVPDPDPATPSNKSGCNGSNTPSSFVGFILFLALLLATATMRSRRG